MATSAEATATPLHICSWNIAGWDATLKYIKSHYKSLDAYLERHGFDILALQEVKLTRQKVTADPAAAHAHPFGDAGWESFWAFPATEGPVGGKSSTAKRGFNGVTTYAKKGLTIAADAAPLGDPSLDGEGRCLLTDHGGFVLLNVYAHATGGDGAEYDAKLARKLAFFNALTALMRRLRDAGKRVMLVGDLNVAARGADVMWKQSLLPISTLRLEEQEEAAAASSSSSSSSSDAAERLHAALGERGRRALMAALPSGGPRGVIACGRIWREAVAVIKGEEGGGGGGGEEEGEEAEEVEATAATEEATAAVASMTDALRDLAHYMGVSSSQKDCVAWLTSLLEADKMVDSFAALHPHARHRFTCWDQYRNQRYQNVGKRIDYLLLDESLYKHALPGAPLIEDETESGAKRAATACGRWLPAATHGPMMGVQEAPMTTHDTQFQPPHSGILYTPPAASDHVATTLLLDYEGAIGRPRGAPLPQGHAWDAKTKACSFRPQAGIKSFFALAQPKRPAAEGGGGSSKRPCA